MENDPFETSHDQLFVRQRKEWTEILVDWETRNHYTVMDAHQNEIGSVAEKSDGVSGFLKRGFLRSHRPFEIGIFDRTGNLLCTLARSFFFFFSDLSVCDPHGRTVGRVQRRFGLIHRKYDLYDDASLLFARIEAPFWRIWTFPVADTRGTGHAKITKRWGGGLREIFSDADTFMIDFMQGSWTPGERRVLFAAAISIDFDFFENNQGRLALGD